MAATCLGWIGCTGGEPSPPAQWESRVAARTGAGYCDNVTLAHRKPEASALLSVGLEAAATRVAVDTPRWSFLAMADHAQYLSAPSVEREQSVLGHAEARQFIGDRVDAGWDLDYVYVNEVLDVSTTETNRMAVLAQGHTVGLRPGVSVDLTPRSWLTMQAPVTRQWYAAPLDDTWAYGALVKLVVECGREGQLSAAYEPGWRDYDTEPPLAADGTPLEGARRRLGSHELSLGWTQPWGGTPDWSTTIGLAAEWVSDNGGGFFDYRRFGGSAGLRFHRGDWEAAAGAGASYYEYPVQTVSATDPRRRERTVADVSVHCSRRLYRQLYVRVGYEWERVIATDAFEEYTAQTVVGSVEWEF